MPRKSAAPEILAAAQAAGFVVVGGATAPKSVATRKRARRAAEPAPVAPVYVKPTIDLTQPNARKALVAAFPAPTSETMIDATEAEERAALAYIEARDAEARAKGAKEAAGNVLCYAIGNDEGIKGDGWKATWKLAKGEVDWSRLCKDLNIEDSVIERYRKPSARRIDLRETADE